MNWTNVKLIFQREVRDQLRDRRTLFMIFVLPVMLYPLLGLSFFQIAQFVREHPTTVLVLGRDELPPSPPLIVADRFSENLFADARNARLLKLQFPKTEAISAHDQRPTAEKLAADEKRTLELAQRSVRDGAYQVVVYFPPGFARQIADHNQALLSAHGAQPGDYPQPLVFHNSASEKSQLAFMRVSEVLDRWRKAIASENLRSAGINPGIVKPFDLKSEDVAARQQRDAAAWSKIFPFLLLIWALTGAFYPAIDLCAGEKERGTLETLLTSPAAREEIVWGKLLTVMSFSMITVLLNLLSMGIAGYFILSQLPRFGPPPISAIGWLLLGLVPISAMFSALCLALAAFARSTKEGQYYLMPLVLITMPLVVIPMAPGVELSLGNSLVPITGMVLLLRNMVEGNYLQALPYVAPVVVVTLLCCLFSIRWAVDQFNTEGVLFRESERLDLGLWMRHLRRDREDLPTVAEAMLCAVVILVVRFFMSFALTPPTDFVEFARLAMITQLVVIATPALLMTIMLTRSPRQTLLLRKPPLWGVPVAVALALLVHPLTSVLQQLVVKLYPLQDEMAAELSRLMTSRQNLWLSLLAIAVVPAICEELAFRGFILSGLRRLGHKWRAIVLASICFGLSHAIFQQSLIAALVGIVIGCLAVQTGSLLPAIVFHAIHNALAILATQVTESLYQQQTLFRWLGNWDAQQGLVFRWQWVALCAWLTLGVLYWMHRQPYRKTEEEALQEAIDHHAARGLVG
jgi:sodium transport system permease protein